MESLIWPLVQIDNDAKKLIDQADVRKQQLDAEYAEKQEAFENQLSAEMSEKLARLSAQLTEKKEQDLARLHEQTGQTLRALDTDYEKNHKKLARQIVQNILD